jgi:uncharacterized membrane protein YecN with MAPEG domain
MGGKEDDVVDANGIPLKSSYDAMPLPVPILYTVFTSVFMAIGQGIAFAIYMTSSKYDSKVDVLAVNGLGWIYVGLVVLHRGCTLGIGCVLGSARKEAKVNVPDQQVYSVYTKPGQPKLGYVLMEKEGVLGRFNRAQRALQNFLESAPFVLTFFLLAGFVFPFPAFCLACFYAAARLISAIGYTHSPDGRMAGNLLGMLGLTVMEALVLQAGIRAIMREA